jgi:outer membrane protein assembly factor BamD
MKRQAYLAAANRAKYVIEHYSGTPATKDALIVLSKAYEKMEYNDLVADVKKVIDLNYGK